MANKKRLTELSSTESCARNPLISIAIPARNEETTIENCLRSFMAQDYKNLEILVLDDDSSDSTAQKVLELQKLDSRIIYIKGKHLQTGWKGKIYAMQQLFEASNGEFLLFTDADTIHSPQSVGYGFHIMEKNKASLLSGYPLQRSKNRFTLALISAMVFNTVLFIPLRFQEKLQSSFYAMAIGQYLFVRKASLSDIGGFSLIKDNICDDVMLARVFAKTGHKQIFADMKNVVSCTMYHSFSDAFRGYERSITGVVKQSPFTFLAILIVVILLLGCVFAVPAAIFMLVYSLAHPELLMPALLLFLGSFLLFGSWNRMALFHGFPKNIAILGPFVFLLVIVMYLHGYYRKATGKGFTWKDRKI
nr:glycosyltransferase [uncultured Sphaerochaeta sp.]